MAEAKATTQEPTLKPDAIKAMSFLERFTHAKHWVANQKINKSGYNKFTKAEYYELADFIQPILDSQVKYFLFSRVYSDYEKMIAYLYVYDSLDDESAPIVYDFKMEDPSMKGVNPMQVQGAIKTYSRRYLYIDGWEITESDFSESLDPDVKVEKKKQEAFNLKEELTNLITMLPEVGQTVDTFLTKHNAQMEDEKDKIKDINDLKKEQVAAYVGIFKKRLADKKK